MAQIEYNSINDLIGDMGSLIESLPEMERQMLQADGLPEKRGLR